MFIATKLPAHQIIPREIEIECRDSIWFGRFPAMACLCEVQCVGVSRSEAETLCLSAANEAWRIQDKFSRYQRKSVTSLINSSDGRPVTIDNETMQLLHYAARCYALSGGQFDITSGVLRRVWPFDGSDNIPTQTAIDEVIPLIGFNKIIFGVDSVTLTPGMEVDLGGIGKEYAVDKVLRLMELQHDVPLLVNFGGDIAANRSPAVGEPWRVGISQLGNEHVADRIVELHAGGIATSGDTQRYLMRDGIRYSHILNPTTGWPAAGAPHSVTVVADTCTDAGILATLAMLQGSEARNFLEETGREHYCLC
ncbi:FAD:protein FMN transferase [Aurantivibrio plasticivorans]